MRAARVHTFGQALQVDDVPEPEAGEGEAVVRLDYAGVNPLDVRICAGGAGRIPLPFTPGLEGVGTTEQGGQVLVYGEGIGMRRAGTYAEQVLVPLSSLIPLDDTVDAVQAAGLGLAGVTAWGALHRTARVTPEDRVLVLGASGGVGNLVVQLAREAGATVWSQVSTEADAGAQTGFGAHETVVGGPDELRDALRPLSPTVVIDPLGGEFTAAALRALEPGGRIVVFGVAADDHSNLDLAMLYRKAAVVQGHAALATSPADVRQALEACLASLVTDRLQVHVDELLPLERVNEAHTRLVDRNVTGKLVLSVNA